MFTENPYVTRNPENYIHDGEPRSLYWAPYRETYERLRGILRPAEPVSGDLPIMLVGNNSLNPFHFDIRKKDRVPLCGFLAPGISGQIAFTQDPHIACGAIFDRDCRRQDHLYIVPRARLFEEINYIIISLPTLNQPLHVRIVHKNNLEDPDIHLPPFSDRTKLAELFSAHRIC